MMISLALELTKMPRDTDALCHMILENININKILAA
jgi:hypothetical protein